MKGISLLLAFAAGALVGWGAHSPGPTEPKELTVLHPDPDLTGASMVTRVTLCRVGDTDVAPFPDQLTVANYWEVRIAGVKYCGIGREVRATWTEARDTRLAERGRRAPRAAVRVRPRRQARCG